MRENGKETEISNADTHTQEHARAHSIQFDEVNARVRVKENFSENFINNAKSITFLLFSLEYGAYFSLVFPFFVRAFVCERQSNPSHAYHRYHHRHHHHHRCSEYRTFLHFMLGNFSFVYNFIRCPFGNVGASNSEHLRHGHTHIDTYTHMLNK